MKNNFLKRGLKKLILDIIDIKPATDKSITIYEPYTFRAECLKNKIWYRGDSYELEQFFKASAKTNIDINSFWAATPTLDNSIRKIHIGLPSIIVNRLVEIVISDLDEFVAEDNTDNEILQNILKDNHFINILQEAIKEVLIEGDGAFKIMIDNNISNLPIIEFVNAENVEYKYKRGRLYEIVFYTEYYKNNDRYKLEEFYGNGYINYKLYNKKGDEVDLEELEETKDLKNIIIENGMMLAIPLKFYSNEKFKGRGSSIYSKKSDCFDALDEVVSQWIDAIRRGRVKTYIPEDLIPRDAEKGDLLKPNPFDNQFIKISADMSEGSQNKITVEQPSILYDAFVNTYLNILDMCLQGIISPSTLGIDLKKTDNAEAQREKEKATIYTRNVIITNITDTLIKLGNLLLNTYYMIHSNTIKDDYNISVIFGEYATPTFDAVVGIVAQAVGSGIMSIEKAIDELYGNTMTDEEKQKEIELIKEQQGVGVVEEISLGDGFGEGEGEGEEQDPNLEGEINE